MLKKEPGLPNHFLFSSDNRGLSEELNAAAKSLTEKINSTVGRLEEKEATAEKDGDKAREALQKANKAQHKATDSSKKVIMAQKELQEISAILSTVEEPGRLLTKHIFILISSECEVSHRLQSMLIKFESSLSWDSNSSM